MSSWKEDSAYVRVGGNLHDAMAYFSQAKLVENECLLRDCFSIEEAALFLRLERVSLTFDRDKFRCKRWNEDAAAGPDFLAFGLPHKRGLKEPIEDYVWNCSLRVARGECPTTVMPWIMSRMAYRTKLRSVDECLDRWAASKPLGRGVVSMSGFESAFSAPLYNALDGMIKERVRDATHPFKHQTAKMSSEWSALGRVVRNSTEIIEADWGQYDLGRPDEDIEFFIDLVDYLIEPDGVESARVKEGLMLVMRRGLIDKTFVDVGGHVSTFNDGVPSGSLWTSLLDTVLNALYVKICLDQTGLWTKGTIYWCGGDDLQINRDRLSTPGEADGLRKKLNEWFGGNMDEEDFQVHRSGDFLVGRMQAIFPPGTDLRGGTSHILDKCVWRPFKGQMRIDEPRGYSHRWSFNFAGKPKFLGCYWTENLLPIKPTRSVLLTGLHPEGVHGHIEDYLAWVVSAVVDNPFNDHCFNHLCHRYLFAKHVQELVSLGLPAAYVLAALEVKSSRSAPLIPFPTVLGYRRGHEPGRVEISPIEVTWQRELNDFRMAVTGLYYRHRSGGLDAYMLREWITGERRLATGQWGSETEDWVASFLEHPVLRSLRPVGRAAKAPTKIHDQTEVVAKFKEMTEFIDELLQEEATQARLPFTTGFADHLN